MMQSHTHDFSYLLLKDEKDHYFGRVSEIPEVVVQGTSQSDISDKISRSTLNYLKASPILHERSVTVGLKPQRLSFDSAIIIGIKPFQIKC